MTTETLQIVGLGIQIICLLGTITGLSWVAVRLWKDLR